MAKGDKHWANTWTEIEDLGNGRRGATITVGHRVFFDKADGNKPKKHKLTDNRPDHVVIQSARCCVEIHPHYAKYFDVQHEEVRVEEERWIVQRLLGGIWNDVGIYNSIITIEETDTSVKVTVTYDTAYGTLIVEYLQRDSHALKHNIYFTNVSSPTKTFRIVQRWVGIAGEKMNGKDFPLDTDEPFLAFRKANGELSIAESLSSMVFNEDGSEKSDHRLQRPVSIGAHAKGMKADFIYGDWILTKNESLEIDPDTATLDNPTVDGQITLSEGSYTRDNSGSLITFGKTGEEGTLFTFRIYIEWDISSIDDGASISKVEFRYNGQTHNTDATDADIRAMASKPSAQAANQAGYQVIYDDAADGTAYLSADTVFPEVGTTKDVGGASGPAWDTDPGSDMEAALSNDWFAIGIKTQETEDPGSFGQYKHQLYSEEQGGVDPAPTLYVEYSTGAAPVGGSPLAQLIQAGLV